MRIFQGEVVIVNFPFTNQADSKVRPAIAISNSSVNSTEDVIFAQITSENYDDAFSFSLSNSDLERPWKDGGAQATKYVRCHKIVTISKSIVQKKINKIRPEELEKLLSQVRSLIE